MNTEPADHSNQSTIFNRFAHHYAVSPVHRSGPDLAVLLKLAAPNPADVALDVATGTGHTALAVGATAAEVVGVDLSPEMLAEARRLAAEESRTNVRFVQASAESLPFAAGTFSLVTARHAPHHFTSVEAFLSEVARVLRPTGRFVLADQVSPAIEDQPWIDQYETIRDPSHHRQRPPAAWRQLAQAAGLVLAEEQLVSYDLDFAWWTKQAGCTPQQVQHLEKLAQEAPTATKARMDLKFDPSGHLQSHRMQVLVARYERRDGVTA
ncbi:MAG TPA: class I SAM-dependent methyltransferase [Chthoniobacterales bacterium]